MDKLAIGFFAEVLYAKGVVCFEEYNDMMEVKQPSDLDTIVQKMMSDGYNGYVKSRARGEGYIDYKGKL